MYIKKIFNIAMGCQSLVSAWVSLGYVLLCVILDHHHLLFLQMPPKFPGATIILFYSILFFISPLFYVFLLICIDSFYYSDSLKHFKIIFPTFFIFWLVCVFPITVCFLSLGLLLTEYNFFYSFFLCLPNTFPANVVSFFMFHYVE